MIIHAALRPGSGTQPAPIVIAVDTLRASTTITVALESGAECVLPVTTVEDGRRLKASRPAALLCGEERALPPEGFDYGNSPLEFSKLDLSGKVIILATSNGTPLLQRYADADLLLVGCLRNAAAVAASAANVKRDVLVACAGAAASGEPAFEDTFTAGAIINELIRDQEGFELGDEAREAFDLFLAHGGDAAQAFRESDHASYLVSIGFGDDVAFCAEPNVSTAVPIALSDDGEFRVELLKS
ncbi:MAG: 2-phosphosulfolactate phosphatase [Dehalococcoidia bacterium]